MGIDLTAEQLRLAANMEDLYDIWRQHAQVLWTGRLRWKTARGNDYLIRMPHGSDSGVSLGRRAEETEKLFEAGKAAEAGMKSAWNRLLVQGRMLKASRVPTIESFAGDVLRNLDASGLLGSHVRIVGSNALPAYEMAAGVRLDPDLHATEDFDVTWVSNATKVPPPAELLDVLRRGDAMWTVNQEKTFQLRNARQEMVEVLIAPSLRSAYRGSGALVPVDTVGQDWLLMGTPVERVVVDLQGKPARIVAPDPRIFALHKLVISGDLTRRADKRHKDRRQGEAILALVTTRLPEYPMGKAWVKGLPEPLREAHAQWQAGLVAAATPSPRKKAGP